MPPYKVEPPTDCDVDFDPVRLADKTAIVTGGEHDQISTAQLTILIILRSQWHWRSLCKSLTQSRVIMNQSN